MKRINGKKSQMELLGMAVIVVFIALGIFFVVKFNILKQPSETKKVYTQSELAGNMLSALIETSAFDCPSFDMLDLMIDCADNYPKGSIVCKEENSYKNMSCEYFNYTINYIFNSTLDTWSTKYVFNITTEATPVLGKRSSNCTGE